MARKRKADHQAAISSAIGLFWREGYAGASTREIEKETGLTRFSLQTAYGGKEKFFLEALDAYLDQAEAQHFPDAENDTPEDLAKWFERLVDCDRIPDIGDSGCLAFNSIWEFDRDDHEVNRRIARYLGAFSERVHRILQRGVDDGTTDLPGGVENCARLLVNMLLGLHVIIKARDNDNLPQMHARSAATLIRTWIR